MTDQEEFYNEILADMKNGTLVLPTLPEVALKYVKLLMIQKHQPPKYLILLLPILLYLLAY